MSEPQSVDILLVEDSATDAELCIRTLKKRNLANSILWVKDGAEALEVLLPQGAVPGPLVTPKVVLLDLRLPKIDGLEVLRRLRGAERTKMTPVVVLTSSNEGRDVAEAYKIGANSFICKPVEFDAFAEMVANLGLYWLVINKPPL